MVRPTVYGQVVIFLVFLPCLTFQGVEGKMFSPMVITLMLRGKVSEVEVPAIRKAKAVYEPWLRRAVARPAPFVAVALGVFALAVGTFFFVGREFMPTLDEQNLNLSSVRIPSTSIAQSVAMDLPLEKAILALPEVSTVYSKAGTASLAADPMPPNASDNYVILKPKRDWPKGVTSKDQVIKRINQAASVVVGNAYDVTQPIEMRFNELIGGVRSDVAVKVYGDDLDKLAVTADQIAGVLRRSPAQPTCAWPRPMASPPSTSCSTATPSPATA
jgi:cobalt-zinc-cadmium resistance protein CzcA